MGRISSANTYLLGILTFSGMKNYMGKGRRGANPFAWEGFKVEKQS